MVETEAPLKKITIETIKSSPWFDGEYKQLRKERRRYEKKFKKTRLLEDRLLFINLRKQTTKLAHDKKCKHYTVTNSKEIIVRYSQTSKPY